MQQNWLISQSGSDEFRITLLKYAIRIVTYTCGDIILGGCRYETTFIRANDAKSIRLYHKWPTWPVYVKC